MEGYFVNNEKLQDIEFIPDIEFIDPRVSDYVSKKCHQRAVRILRNLVASISRLIQKSNDEDIHETSRGKYVIEYLKEYLSMIPNDKKKKEHLLLFYGYEIQDYIVQLYLSPFRNNKEIAEESIRLFMYPNIHSFPIYKQHQLTIIVLGFCELLRHKSKTTSECLLYYSCRHTYGSLIQSIGSSNTEIFFNRMPMTLIRDVYPFMNELRRQLVVNMKLIRQSCFCRVPFQLKSRFQNDISQFSLFNLHICTNIEEHMRSKDLPLHSLPMVASPWGINYDDCFEYYVEELIPFYDDFDILLNNVDLGLTYMDDGVEYTRCTQCEFNHGWSYYLSVLKELDAISKLYLPAEKNLSSCLYSHQDSINKLIMRSKRGDDHQWLLRHKSLVSNESRRHLIKMMFPDQVQNGSHIQTVSIDRSKLVVDSFEQVGLANPISLRNGIIPQFKNEQLVAGPCVLGEWLRLVCQHLFTPENSLFVSYQHNQERLFPNPGIHSTKVDAQQLEYYRFCGRLIGLAMMHGVVIGIGFDRLFFLQLAGSTITLEDICDADPYMYKSCNDILKMDTEFIDADGLGLTFVWETEEVEEGSGSTRKIVELCPGGSTMGVYSINREEYIKLVIQHCFVESIAEKVKLFIQGLDDVLTRKCRKSLFRSIELEDLNYMLLHKTTRGTDWSENRNGSEVVDDSSRSTCFQRIVETVLPNSGGKYTRLPLSCKLESGLFLV